MAKEKKKTFMATMSTRNFTKVIYVTQAVSEKKAVKQIKKDYPEAIGVDKIKEIKKLPRTIEIEKVTFIQSPNLQRESTESMGNKSQ